MVKAKVLDVDVEKERISLGIKQLTTDPFAGRLRRRPQGRGRDLHGDRRSPTAASRSVWASGLTGFIRKSDLSRDRSEQRPDRFAVGEKVDAKVTNVDKQDPQAHPLHQGPRGRGGEEGDAGIRVVGCRRQPGRYPGCRAQAARGSHEGRRINALSVENGSNWGPSAPRAASLFGTN
ncbi:MAG: S1 RNA-binding domain-containing protein [Thalassobaculum sp.]